MTKMRARLARRKTHITVRLLAVAGIFCGCSQSKPHGEPSSATELSREPVVPAGYQKIAPAPIDSSVQMLGQTASIFRGVLKTVEFSYEDCAGPRTEYVFGDSSSLAGAAVTAQITVKVLGGPTPRGTWVGVSELPQLALDSQYIVFLRNTDWTFSPIVGNLAFRVETIGGREVLVDPSGHAVKGWGEEGPVLSAGMVSEPVGNRKRGYRGADSPTRPGQNNSSENNPKGEVRPASGVASGQTADQGRTPDALIARAPSEAEIHRAGLFAKPSISAAAIGNEPTVSVNSFIESIRAAAERAQIQIGGRIALNPNWRCWSTTPTMKVAQ